VEKHSNLPVSFLCDRETTAVAKSQPGFVDFIVAPLFTTIYDVSPDLSFLLQQAKANAAKWKVYEETEADKQVYLKKPMVEIFKKFGVIE
jgi:hypothetical protein